MHDPDLLRTATFDPKVRLYWLYVSAWIFVSTVVGIPLLLPWLLGIGQLYCRKAFDRLECQLTARALHLRKGLMFRTERTIPLDKIQDLSLHTGPVLRALGLTTIHIETAGQSQQGTADLKLLGVVDAESFRDAVIAQRDRVTLLGPAAEAAPTRQAASSELEVLAEIRDHVATIAAALERQQADPGRG